jgi:hypothetical protein
MSLGRIGKSVQIRRSRATVTGEQLISSRREKSSHCPLWDGKARWEALGARSQETYLVQFAHDPSRQRSERPDTTIIWSLFLSWVDLHFTLGNSGHENISEVPIR